MTRLPAPARSHLGTVLVQCFLILIVIGGASYFIYRHGAEAVREKASAQFNEVATSAVSGTEQEFALIVESLHEWASQPVLLRILDGDVDNEIAGMVSANVTRFPYAKELTCTSSSGDVVASSSSARLVDRIEVEDEEAAQFANGARASIRRSGLDFVITVPVVFEFDKPETLGYLRLTAPASAFLVDHRPRWSALLAGDQTVLAERTAARESRAVARVSPGASRAQEDLVRTVVTVMFPEGVVGPDIRVAVGETRESLYGPIAVLGWLVSWLTLGASTMVLGLFLVFTRRNRVLAHGLELRAIELEKVNTDLESSQEELRRQTLRAEAANRFKGEFLANMSHEIRTPMNGVIGMTTLLLDSELSPDQREFAETIQSSGKSLLTIINDILDTAKIEAGKMQVERIRFDLWEVVEESVEVLAEKACGKGLDLCTFIEASTPRNLLGDPARLRQVLINLCGNAVKFTSTGEVSLHLGIETPVDGPPRLRFEVSDSGIGIPSETLERLFQPFQQADGSTSRRFGGTGLGLAISKHLVELMGGEVGARSDLGHGSTFWFTLPCETGCVEASEPEQDSRLRGTKVLCAVDSPTLRAVLHHHLSAIGAMPRFAEDADQILNELSSARPGSPPCDLIVIDSRFSGINGLELLRRVRALPDGTTVPAVLLTSFDQHRLKFNLKDVLSATVMPKPVRASRLVGSMGTALGLSSASPEDAKLHQEPLPLLPSRRQRVLLVEDNPVNREVARRMLERLGCTLDLAVNGQEAVDYVKRDRDVLVLMDCQMPVMDGYEATARIREEQAQGGTRTVIVALTAQAMSSDRERCLQAGMDDYLTKPIVIADLKAMLAKWRAPESARSDFAPLIPTLPITRDATP